MDASNKSDTGFSLFKIGIALTILGVIAWLGSLYLDQEISALFASFVAAIGGILLMVAVLGSKH